MENEILPKNEKYRFVMAVTGKLNGEIMKAFLNANGIHVKLYQESVGIVYGLESGPLGNIEIHVPESDFETAKQLIQQMNDGELEIENNIDEDNQEESAEN